LFAWVEADFVLEMNIRALITSTRGRRFVLVLLLVIIAVVFVRGLGTFLVVDGMSMLPTFSPNDVVHARPMHAEVQRGDVVIIADDRGDEIIKRIIALPGECVTLYRGFVYINRRRLAEPYLPKFTYTYQRDQQTEKPMSWLLADDEYFVLGDNRLHSADSRHYGPVLRHKMRSVVSTPDNSVRPTFTDIMPQETGRVVHTKDRAKVLPKTSQPSPASSAAP